MSQIRTYYETKETKNQVFSNIPFLLVCPVGISGGWSPEIPDIGGLLRLLRIGGGITFGGGEPLLSCKEILHFHKSCIDNGKQWKINIETSLNVLETFVEVVEKIVNHWIVDIKDMNPEIYKAYTGVDNHLVISNLQHLIEKKAKITVRVPIIPNFNTEADIEKSIETLQKMGITDIEQFTYTIKEH